MVIFLRIWFFVIILVTNIAVAKEQDLLVKGDIKDVMQEMLLQHVSKKQMTPEIFQTAVQNYIDQFDSSRIYLLESEVEPYLNASFNEALADYQRNQYPIFHKLDNLFQHAIARSKGYRLEQEKNIDQLFANADHTILDQEWRLSDRKRPFAKDLAALKQRIREEMLAFISSEQKRFGRKAVDENKQRTIRTYENSLEHLESRYLYTDKNGTPFTQIEQENQFVLHVLKALSRSLDSHSTFFNPQEAHDMKVQLEKGFEGIGVVLQRRPEGVVIASMVQDGPAERSGKVKENDLIIGVNSVNVENFSLNELMDEMRNDTLSTTTLDLKRGSEKITVTLQREQLSLNNERVDISFEKYGDGIIGKITLHSFYQGENGITSEKDIRKAIAQLEREGKLNGLILDLRENSGGFLSQAVKVAGLFITNGVVVISKYSDGQERYYRDMDGKTSFEGPLIVLTSRATASAAEIVAQAIQDYGVGIVVGDEQTYGKGTIQSQTVTDNNSHSFFKVTVGKYYTPSGKTPQMQGVKADIVVPTQFGDEQIGEAFLEYPIGFDTIDPAFHDQLLDVEPGLKPWYDRYYLPTLQKKETHWHAFLPELRKKSESRLAHNPEYDRYIREEGKWSFFNTDPNRGEDPQMAEATNILKDMVDLEQQGQVASSKH